jgi:nitrogen fixation protein NifX
MSDHRPLAGADATVKVAFATADLRHVDQHFGAAESFVVYQVGAREQHLVEAIQFSQPGVHLKMDGNEDKLAAKIAALEGCLGVYCEAVGASAVSQLRARGIQPIKVAAGTTVSSLIRGLQQELREGTSGWVVRAMANRDPSRAHRFDAMEAEGWRE